MARNLSKAARKTERSVQLKVRTEVKRAKQHRVAKMDQFAANEGRARTGKPRIRSVAETVFDPGVRKAGIRAEARVRNTEAHKRHKKTIKRKGRARVDNKGKK